jgi:Ca2+-binding EF-hand superfamily protein
MTSGTQAAGFPWILSMAQSDHAGREVTTRFASAAKEPLGDRSVPTRPSEVGRRAHFGHSEWPIKPLNVRRLGGKLRNTSNHPLNGGESMLSRRSVLLTSAVAILSGAASPVLAASRQASAVQMFDTDKDGTLDLLEAKKAATALFTKLDGDHDGSVDQRELAGRLSAKEFAAADPDHDGSLTLFEYLAVVEQRFNAANHDKDGTLDARELNTRAGRALVRLLK